MINYKSDPDGGLIEIAVDGPITRADIETVFAQFKTDVARCGRVKVLETIGHIGGIEPSALWRDLELGLPLMKTVSHAAVVTDQKWLGVLTDLTRPFISAQVRHFTPDHAAEARAWLESV